MTTPKIKVDGVDLFIVPSGFVFVSQTCVKFYGRRLHKHELIKCCDYFISELKLIYTQERLKIGFSLRCFKYYEISVYLHGLISLFCSKNDILCPSCFSLFMFSHLPHEILKPEKENQVINVSKILDSLDNSLNYCCVINGCSLCSVTPHGLRDNIDFLFPDLIHKYNIILDIN